MLTLLFEDRLVVDNERYIGLSYLLKQACNNILRCEVEFSETNCALLEKAGSIIGDGQKVMAFLDIMLNMKLIHLKIMNQYLPSLPLQDLS